MVDRGATGGAHTGGKVSLVAFTALQRGGGLEEERRLLDAHGAVYGLVVTGRQREMLRS